MSKKQSGTSINRRILSTMLALSLLLTLMPSFINYATAVDETTTIDFKTAASTNPSTATIAANGWKLDIAGTYVSGQYPGLIDWKNDGITAIITDANYAPYSDVAIVFSAPQTGTYNLSVDGCQYYSQDQYCGVVSSVYVDGVLAGVCDFSGAGKLSAGQASTGIISALNDLGLTAGEHTITFRRTSGGEANRMRLYGLILNQTSSSMPPAKQNINLKSTTSLSLTSATLAADGWQVNQDKTAAGILTNGYGGRNPNSLNAATGDAGYVKHSDLAIDFNVTGTGNYALSLEGLQYFSSDWYCGALTSIFVDDTYVGEYDFSGAGALAVGDSRLYSQNMNSIPLTAGTHTLTIRRINSTGGYFFRVSGFEITPVSPLPTVSSVALSGAPSEIAPNATAKLSAVVTMSDSSTYHFGTTYNKEADANNKLEFASANSGIVAVTLDGSLTAVAEGTTTVYATATVGGVATQSSAASVTVKSNAILSSITITTPPAKTAYTVGDTLDTTGMVVTAAYSDTTSAAVAGYTCDPTTLSTDGTQQVTVSYTKGEVTKTATFNVTVNPAPELMPETGRIRATATDATTDTSLSGTVISSSAAGFAQNDPNNFAIGTEMTLQAATVSGKTFRYWKNVASKRIVSTNQNYTFKVGSDTYLTAVYSEPSEGQYLVEFLDKNGKILQSNYLNENDPIVKPADPFSVGYTFSGWSPTVPAIATANHVFNAQYTVLNPSFTVTLAGPAVISGGNQSPYSYNQQINLSVDSGSVPAGQKFTCWKRDGKVVSYDENYSFYVWDNTTVTAVCELESVIITKAPQVMMDIAKVVGNRVIFMSERTLPTGYELIETGVLLKQGNGTVSNMKLVGGSYDIKAVSQSQNANGQFTVRKDGTTGMWTACAYLIYKSGSDVKVIYSNIVNGTV